MKRLILIAALLLGAAVAEAQPGPGGPGGPPPGAPMPPGRWWRRGEVAQKLELKDVQKSQLDQIFESAADELIESKSAVRKLEMTLRNELDRAQLRRAEVQKVATQLSAARAKLFERELLMLMDMREVLEPHQWERLQQGNDRQPPFHFGTPRR